jgi:UDP-N-acetylmuramoylalanine--D-glutamate ligase
VRDRPPLPGGPYLVVGLARSGAAAALALRARGEEVIGVDAGATCESAGRLSEAGVEVHLDESGAGLAAKARALIKSPGVPQNAPPVVSARAAAIPVLGELELAWRLLPNEFIAVTGTNGKTTTTEWIGHIHRCAGLPVAVAGNVGTALSSLVGAVSPETTVVAECSSFQLEDSLEFAPEAALLLNLSPDHLDRHGTFAAYSAAKLRVFEHQRAGDIAVVPPGFEPAPAGALRYGTGVESELAGKIALPGAHNRQNGLAAAAVCLARGIECQAVVEGLKSFRGVAHRLEHVASIAGVAYVNDSKATNVASTEVALRSFDKGVHLILGGVGKAQDFTPLAPLVAERCAAVYLIGEAAGDLREALRGLSVDAGDLEHAVSLARAAAAPGDTVLLSPACASYDQYPNFEARGEHFRALVEALA